jgi:uncharacterized protein YbjT (DUF2867 family)
MNNHTNQLIVVAGATGTQGGAVARHLLKQGWKVRALTRDPNKDAAKALAKQGAEIFQNDLDDRAGLDDALKGAYGAFGVQNFWLPNVGYAGEVRQGKIFADAAKAAEIQHLVYSSVGAAHRGMGQKHFDSKWEIEQYIQSLNLPYTILRPVAFMDNYFWSKAAISNGMFFSWGLRPDKPLQLIAADDIGGIAAVVFADPQKYIGKTLEIAGDQLTEPRIAETFTRVVGRPVNVVQAQLPEGQSPNEEQIAMFQFFNGQAYDADIEAVRKMYPPLQGFEEWLNRMGWKNLPVMEMPKEGGAWG